jgi:moderate conductance mechanosensitive channel
MMTKPGGQFGLRRQALAMIKQAFDENGIKIAFPTVTIAGKPSDGETAAAQSVISRMSKDAEAAGGRLTMASIPSLAISAIGPPLGSGAN